MGRISNRVANYTLGKGSCKDKQGVFYTIQEVYNTMFDIRCSTKKKWGYLWYDLARYGDYEGARRELINKPACIAKSVAIQCVDDLEYLQALMDQMEKGDR